jgi:hypothetical protein
MRNRSRMTATARHSFARRAGSWII